MKRYSVFILVFFLTALITLPGDAVSQERGTSAEARELVKKAVSYVREAGREKALAEFNVPKGKFTKKDLYITVTSMTGVNLAHGATPALNGKDLLHMKDSDGKPLIQDMIEVARKQGKGETEYKWNNPVTKKMERKVVYSEKVDDMIISCGYYK